MSKNKKREKKGSAPVVVQPLDTLPQNIFPMGGKVEEDKNIYISQKVYKEIQKFTWGKTSVESGGMLIGTTVDEFDKTNILITGFIEAKHSEGTPTTLTFTHETWAYVHGEMEKRFPGQKIVGWIHTHPDFGIFLSEYDKFIHQNFFSEDYQIAYVVDPIQKIEGFYFWINGKIQKCAGFYIFDETGTEIQVGEEEEKKVSEVKKSSSLTHSILIAVLSVAVIMLFFMRLSDLHQIQFLKEQQAAIVDAANANLGYFNQHIGILYQEIDALKSAETVPADSEMPDSSETVESEAAETQDNTVQETTASVTENPDQTEPTATQPADTQPSDAEDNENAS